MKYLLTGFALLIVIAGLWRHDWRLILAGAAVAAIWPLLSADVEAVAREAKLDALWDEDEC